MGDKTGQPRPPRLHVRLPCELELGDARIAGHSHNLSATGLYVRVPDEALRDVELQPGRDFLLRLLLPEQRSWTRVRVEVVWLEPGEHGPGGEPLVGLGLRMLELGAQARARLESFVREFHHSVLVIDAQPPPVLQEVLAESYRLLHSAGLDRATESSAGEAVAVLLLGQPRPTADDAALLSSLLRELPHAQLVQLVHAGSTVPQALQVYLQHGRFVHRLPSPPDPAQLKALVDRAVDAYAAAAETELLQRELRRANQRLQRENQYLRRRALLSPSFAGIVGNSTALRTALSQLERVRETSVTVHIGGETGTGKELVARALHAGGPRAREPFVTQNCAGLTETLLQSTLFGHRRGAFTGADRDQPGVFQEADRGTLLLDEVAELAPATQGMLLRVLETGELTPVGASRPVHVDVRLISATNKDLWREVEAGRFREDLYFRLMVVALELPPLRQRAGDVPLLATHFLDLQCQRHGKDVPGFTTEAMEVLEQYTWPGNVRELENEVERLVVLSTPRVRVPAELLSPRILDAVRGRSVDARPDRPTDAPLGDDYATLAERFLRSGRGIDEVIAALESTILGKALDRAQGNRTQAARELRLARQTLHSRIRRYGLRDRDGTTPAQPPGPSAH